MPARLLEPGAEASGINFEASGGDDNHPRDPSPTHLGTEVVHRRAMGVIIITSQVTVLHAVKIALVVIDAT